MLSICSTWFARGRGKQFEIPTRWRRGVSSRWGSQGRINLLGSLSLHGEQQQLEYRLLDGTCTRTEVVTYLETLAKQCQPNELTVVVLDNAGFHKGGEMERHRAAWEQQGLYLRYLPAYCPFLNLIEGTWRKLKGFLMPRRCYNSLDELKEALLAALHLMQAVQL
ncbi:transposase [Deinococcus peraridilitoris]|uniref:Tc1-like transposase DDE domain-containing protein n=1 Tax=Deinococcus peraridilitoris (strain DSM 19664 / LMG 22246 / CIP 109416 / KR-200) TaxID=937777 RepID=L0A216_DEIPD|nr:transposase [Deinococcus peraridilitoris]AFZ67207.1 hypothetical protein Deipe_1678 [Deinococcus peraridilitoris DSM 19664]